jgi:TolB protein
MTNHPGADGTPTWSPTGTHLAFVSDRSGQPQIYRINVDGTDMRRISTESYCDRPTWSPAPFNEIAYTARSSAAGYDISVYDFQRGTSIRITDGIGSNESPAFAPNGRHIAFVSTRAGKEQIFTIARDGKEPLSELVAVVRDVRDVREVRVRRPGLLVPAFRERDE